MMQRYIWNDRGKTIWQWVTQLPRQHTVPQKHQRVKQNEYCLLSQTSSTVFAYLVVLRPARIAAAVQSAPRVELPVDSGHRSHSRMQIATALSVGVDHTREKRGACEDEAKMVGVKTNQTRWVQIIVGQKATIHCDISSNAFNNYSLIMNLNFVCP